MTLVPSAANIDAYSMPMTPAPTTTIDVGMNFRSRMPSESSTRSSSNSTPVGRSGLVPRGDDEVAATHRDAFGTVGVLDMDGVLVDESGVADVQLDAVAHQLRAHHVDLLADDVLGARQQVSRGDLLLDAVAGAVELPLAHAGEVDDRLAQRLRRNRSGVDADPTEHASAFDHRDRLAELRGSDGGLLPTWPRPDDDEVVLLHRTHGTKVYAGWADLACRRGQYRREQRSPSTDARCSTLARAVRQRRAFDVGCHWDVRRMTTFDPRHFPLDRPGKLIAALPAVLGFVPEKSLVLVTLERGELGCVMRVDLSDDASDVVVQHGRGRRRQPSRQCHRGDRRRGGRVVPDVQATTTAQLADAVGDALKAHGIELLGRARRRPDRSGWTLALCGRLRQQRGSRRSRRRRR